MFEEKGSQSPAVAVTGQAMTELQRLFSEEKYKDKALRIVFQGFG